MARWGDREDKGGGEQGGVRQGVGEHGEETGGVGQGEVWQGSTVTHEEGQPREEAESGGVARHGAESGEDDEDVEYDYALEELDPELKRELDDLEPKRFSERGPHATQDGWVNPLIVRSRDSLSTLNPKP